MFTGLVAELGKVTAIVHGESSYVLTVFAPLLTP
jgi:riboflavin synthase alpha subunit